jgi:hypothetical protein
MMDEFKDHLIERGQEARNQGIGELEQYAGATMPQTNFKIIGLLHDVIMCEYDDCNEDNTEIERDGIWINIDVTKSMWRSAVVLLAGPNVSPNITVGTRVCFPNDKGIKSIQINNGTRKNIIFLNEDRIFGILAPKE